jgi:uncharacterized damage-inducible protein DinB
MTSPAPSPAGDRSAGTAEDLRYPIGGLVMPDRFDAAWRAQAIQVIADTPTRLAQAVAGWSDERLDTPYRPGGWTVRQVVHHVADSHMNAVMRFKLALTEQEPAIRGYDEAAWAELPDTQRVPIEVSLELLDALHMRWVALLQAMGESEFTRTLIHPKHGPRTLDQMLATYAWHGPHHIAHITRLAQRAGW